MNQCMICAVGRSMRDRLTIQKLGLHAPMLQIFQSLTAFEPRKGREFCCDTIKSIGF